MTIESREFGFDLSLYSKSFDIEGKWTTGELFDIKEETTFSVFVSSVVDKYRDPGSWQYFIGPLIIVYTIATFIVSGIRIDLLLIVMPLIASCYIA